MFHIAVEEKGLLYPDIYNRMEFVSVNGPFERLTFRKECVEKKYPILVEVIMTFSVNKRTYIEEFLRVCIPDSYEVF